MVVGVIDSGVAPNHPSLLDTVDVIPRGCRGAWAKAVVPRFDALQLLPASSIAATGLRRRRSDSAAGAKPVRASRRSTATTRSSARVTTSTDSLTRHKLDPHEFRSPRDAAGHGTHVATTIAGNLVDAYLFGTRSRRFKVSRRARASRSTKRVGSSPAKSRRPVRLRTSRALSTTRSPTASTSSTTLSAAIRTTSPSPTVSALLNAFDAGVLRSSRRATTARTRHDHVAEQRAVGDDRRRRRPRPERRSATRSSSHGAHRLARRS